MSLHDAAEDASAAERQVEDIHARLLETTEPTPPRRRDVVAMVRREHPLLDTAAVDDLVERVLARVGGLGPLEPLLADPAITDVLVNGPGPVWFERHGRLEQAPVTLDTDQIDRLIERIVGPLGLRADRSSPLVDARLPDGSRVNAVVPPLAVDGPCLAIRRFRVEGRRLEELGSRRASWLLRWAIATRANVLVVGGTGAGKTTLLNALAAELPAGERIVTVEDTAELDLPHEHVVRLEARPASADGIGQVSIRELVRNALRLRPDRIVVGEVRGPEALDMLQAMNTGHEGSLSTCHANSPRDALRRVETMILLDEARVPLAAIREQLSSALDLVVQIERSSDGHRHVSRIDEVATQPDGQGRVEVRPLLRGDEIVDLPSRRRSGPEPDRAWLEGGS